MAIEIVDFPMKHGGSFQFAMLVYQRVIVVIVYWKVLRPRISDGKWIRKYIPSGSETWQWEIPRNEHLIVM